MSFRPNVGDTLEIKGVLYSIAAHPSAPGMPYGQEGRAAIVYQLKAGEEKQALKVFKPRFQVPSMVILAERLESFAKLPGLKVCHRSVLTARRHAHLVREHPDLDYAVLMPWIEGPTWMEVLLFKHEITKEQSLSIAHGLVDVLATMEERGLAHCDLSGPNILLPVLATDEGQTIDDSDRQLETQPHGSVVVELVDVEQMYGEELKRLELLPSGSGGYAHKTAREGLWSSVADRFAGTMLVSEMLGWCDSRVRDAAWGESYFDPKEMHSDGARYDLLVEVLRENWGDSVAGLLQRAWESDTLADCPTFGRWMAALPDAQKAIELEQGVGKRMDKEGFSASGVDGAQVGMDGRTSVQVLLEKAQKLEREGNLEGAVGVYREAAIAAPAGSGLAAELALIAGHVESAFRAQGGQPVEAGGTDSMERVGMQTAPAQPPDAETGATPSAQAGVQEAANPLEHSIVTPPTPQPPGYVPPAPSVRPQTYQPPVTQPLIPQAAQPQPQSQHPQQQYAPPAFQSMPAQQQVGPLPMSVQPEPVARTPKREGTGRTMVPLVPVVLLGLLLVLFGGMAVLFLSQSTSNKGEQTGTTPQAQLGAQPSGTIDAPTVAESATAQDVAVSSSATTVATPAGPTQQAQNIASPTGQGITPPTAATGTGPPTIGDKVKLADGVTITLVDEYEKQSTGFTTCAGSMYWLFTIENTGLAPFVPTVSKESAVQVDSTGKKYKLGESNCVYQYYDAFRSPLTIIEGQTGKAAVEFSSADIPADATHLDLKIKVNGQELVFRYPLK